jgi:hypothetical protein
LGFYSTSPASCPFHRIALRLTPTLSLCPTRSPSPCYTTIVPGIIRLHLPLPPSLSRPKPLLRFRRRSSSRSLAALAASFPHLPFPSLRRVRLSFSPIASPSTPSPLLLPRLRTLPYASAPSCLSCRPPLFSLLTLPPIPPPVAPSRAPYLLRPIFPDYPLPSALSFPPHPALYSRSSILPPLLPPFAGLASPFLIFSSSTPY